MLACRPDDPAVPPQITLVEGSTRKVCQLTGETDRQFMSPAHNLTVTRYGVYGTDLGQVFEHAGVMWFLFGDTYLNLQYLGGDSIGYSADPEPEDCVDLDFVADAECRYLPPRVPGIGHGFFEVPAEGVGRGASQFIYFTGNDPNGTEMTRSYLARTDDFGRTFELVYENSTDKFVNLSGEVVDPLDLPGFGQHQGDIWIYVGSGTYRGSDPCMAYVPLDDIEDHAEIRYLTGLDATGCYPDWSPHEEDAAPLFDHPVIGEVSLTYNELLGCWLMLYNAWDMGPHTVIALRAAPFPWGPWSEPLVVFDPVRDDAFCNYIHVPWNIEHCDNLHELPFRENEWGGSYGPYVIERFTKPTSEGAIIYFNMSTWIPYQVVLMAAELRIAD